MQIVKIYENLQKTKSGKNRSRLSKNLGVDKGPQPLMFNPALTTCASERMKTLRFSYFAGFAARELMREAKPVKPKKWRSATFLTLKAAKTALLCFYAFIRLISPLSASVQNPDGRQNTACILCRCGCPRTHCGRLCREDGRISPAPRRTSRISP